MDDPTHDLWREHRLHRQAQDEVARRHASELVGMSVGAAQDLADGYQLKLRLIELPSREGAMVTDEYELGRITAYAANGVVIRSSAG